MRADTCRPDIQEFRKTYEEHVRDITNNTDKSQVKLSNYPPRRRLEGKEV
jgi:hypothetical protein